jgi:regulator of protease activity HflC (stomatin/prohibitin superfamily)
MDVSADTTSAQEKQQREAQLRAALAGLSESEAEMDVNETEEEREARELREKQVREDQFVVVVMCYRSAFPACSGQNRLPETDSEFLS